MSAQTSTAYRHGTLPFTLLGDDHAAKASAMQVTPSLRAHNDVNGFRAVSAYARVSSRYRLRFFCEFAPVNSEALQSGSRAFVVSIASAFKASDNSDICLVSVCKYIEYQSCFHTPRIIPPE